MAFRALLSSQRATQQHACSVEDPTSSSSAFAASAAAAAARAAAAGAAAAGGGGGNPFTAFLSSITTDPLRTRQLAEGYNVGEGIAASSKGYAAAAGYGWTPQQLLSSADSSEQRFMFAADDVPGPLLPQEELHAVEDPTTTAADSLPVSFPTELPPPAAAATIPPPAAPIAAPATAPAAAPSSVAAVAPVAETAAAAAAPTDNSLAGGRLGELSAWRLEWERSREVPQVSAGGSYWNPSSLFPPLGAEAAAALPAFQPPVTLSSSSTSASLLPAEDVSLSPLHAAAAAAPSFSLTRALAFQQLQQLRPQQQQQQERWPVGGVADKQQQHLWTEAFQKFCMREREKAARAEGGGGGDTAAAAAASLAAPSLLPLARFPQRQQQQEQQQQEQQQQEQRQQHLHRVTPAAAAESRAAQQSRDDGGVLASGAAAAPAANASVATDAAALDAAAAAHAEASSIDASAGAEPRTAAAAAPAPGSAAVAASLPLLQTPVAGFTSVVPFAAQSFVPSSPLFSAFGSSSSAGGWGLLPQQFASAAAAPAAAVDAAAPARELERLQREEQERLDLWNYSKRLAAEAARDVQLESAAAAAEAAGPAAASAAASFSSQGTAAAFEEAAATALRDTPVSHTPAHSMPAPPADQLQQQKQQQEQQQQEQQQQEQQQNVSGGTDEQALLPDRQFFDAQAAREMLESMRNGIGEEKFARSEFAFFISKIAEKELGIVDNKLVNRYGELVDWEAEWQQHLLAAEHEASSGSSSAADAAARRTTVAAEKQQQRQSSQPQQQQETPQQQQELGETVQQREEERAAGGGAPQTEKLSSGDAESAAAAAEASAGEQQQQAQNKDGAAFLDSVEQLKAEWLHAHEAGEIDEEELGLFNSIIDTAELREAFGTHVEEELAAACSRPAAGMQQEAAAAAAEGEKAAAAAAEGEAASSAAERQAGAASRGAAAGASAATTQASSRLLGGAAAAVSSKQQQQRSIGQQGEGGGEEAAAEASPLRFATNNPFAGAAAPLALALQLLQQGRLQEAILALQVEVQQNPTSSEGWRLLGEALADSEQDSEAIACLRRGHEVDPYNLDSLLSLGISLTNEWDNPEALRFLRTWLCTHEDFASLEGLQQEAPQEVPALEQHVVQLFEDAAALKPEDEDMHLALGVLSHIQQRWDTALFHFAEALKFSSGLREASLWNKIGATLANSGRSAAALLAYEQALRLRRNYPRAWTNTGVAYANLGDFKEALRHYLCALLLNPEATHLWQYLRSALVGLGRLDLLPFVKNRDLGGLQKLLPKDMPADKHAVLQAPAVSADAAAAAAADAGRDNARLLQIFEMIS